LRPVDIEKVFKRDLRKNSCLASPSAIMRVLSAYYKTGKSWLCSIGIGRLSKPIDLALFIKDRRKLASTTKSNGGEGSQGLNCCSYY
jgi:hypothetical protein